MGSHLGVTLQAGVAARSHRRLAGESVRDNLNTLVRCSEESRSKMHTAKHRKKSSDEDHSGKSSHSSGTTVAEITYTNRGESLLHIATRHNRQEIVLREIRNGADVNVQTKNLQTPLHIACQRGFYEIVRILLENGAELEVRNGFGETPLQIAKGKEYGEIVRLLVLRGKFVGRRGVN